MPETHFIADVPVKGFIQEEGRVLLIKEPDGQYALPGGRMNQGEVPSETLRREMEEELGLAVHVGELVDYTIFTSKNGTNHFVVIFSASLIDVLKNAKLQTTEAIAAEWVALQDTATLPIRAEYRAFFSKLLAKQTV